MLAELDSRARRIIAFQTRPGPPAPGSGITIDAADARRLWPEIAIAQSADVVALDDVLFGEAVGEALGSAAAGRLVLVRTDWTDSFGLLDHLLMRPGNRHLLANRLRLIIQQRLVRVAPESSDGRCAFGAKRLALFEVLVVSEAMRHGLRTGQPAESLRTAARKEGFRTLADEANRWVTASIMSEAAAARQIS
jgi:general secretion pathway protein E